MDKLVTIKTFNYPHEAMVVQGRLESEGIPCFLKDAVVTQVHPFYSNAVGGVKLQIMETDNVDKHPEKIYYEFEKLRIFFSNRKLWRRILTLIIVILAIIYFYNYILIL